MVRSLFFAGVFPSAGVCDAKSAFPLGHFPGSRQCPGRREAASHRPKELSAPCTHICTVGFVIFYTLQTAGRSSLVRQSTVPQHGQLQKVTCGAVRGPRAWKWAGAGPVLPNLRGRTAPCSKCRFPPLLVAVTQFPCYFPANFPCLPRSRTPCVTAPGPTWAGAPIAAAGGAEQGPVLCHPCALLPPTPPSGMWCCQGTPSMAQVLRGALENPSPKIPRPLLQVSMP